MDKVGEKLDVLGSIGQLYMFLLLVVMVMGFGLAAWSAINFIVVKKVVKPNNPNNDKQKTEIKTTKDQIIQNKRILGGLIMNSNGFFKLAIFSLAGIFISAVILTFTSGMSNNNNQNGMNMQGTNDQMNMSSQPSNNGQMNMNNQVSNNGQMNMSNTSAQSNMNSQGNQSNSLANIEAQLQMMEKQIIQIQQYIQNGNMNNSSSGGSSSMPMPAAPAAAPAPAAPMAMPMM